MLRAQSSECRPANGAEERRQDGLRGGVEPLGAAGVAGAGALGFAGKAGLLLLMRTFAPPAWRLLQAASCLWVLPWRRRLQLPPALDRGMAAVAPPLLALWAAGLLLQQLAPDAARTLHFWRLYLPLHVRYTFTRLRWQERRGYSKQARPLLPIPRVHGLSCIMRAVPPSGPALTRACKAAKGQRLDLLTATTRAQEVEAAWERRHAWGAPRVCSLLRDMSGYYVKSAQILASKGDFLPEAWIRQLTPVFFDSMQPRPFRQLQQALLTHLQATPFAAGELSSSQQPLLERAFASIEPAALATASIAQVHCAQLSPGALAALRASSQGWECGTDVVVKVQHADMQGLMEADIRELRRLCAFVRSALPYDPTPMLDEMRDTVGKEFDFQREALLMRVIGARLADDGLAIRVPQPALSLCSRGLLVMQRMQGVPFSRVLTGSDDGLRARAAAALPGLIDCYGRMIFRDGLFHADPHAGNLLLQEDGGLALLDFGQCKALPAARQAALARLIVAIARGSDLEIALAMSGFGMDFSALGGGLPSPALIRKVALICFDTRDIPEARINPLASEAIIKKVPLREAPEDLFSLGRTVMLLRGLCFALGVDIKAAEVWRPWAEAALRRTDLAAAAALNARLDAGEAGAWQQ